MVGKILLPCLGGVPAVWTTCMLFFQTALLAGYIYAEKSVKLLGCEKQSVIHLMLMVMGFLLLPVNIITDGVETAFNQPVSWLLARLGGSIGFLFFIMAANAPLIQRYYSQAGQKDSTDPYFLYSASNAGSLLALLAYPFAFEPLMSVSQHRFLWSGLYVFQTILVFISCLFFWKNGSKYQENAAHTSVSKSPAWSDAGKWVLYGFLPCSAMLGVTTHIATDIASGPLLWIFPLSLYLISFILVFARTSFWRDIRWERYLFPVVLVTLIMYQQKLSDPTWVVLPVNILAMFLVCMCYHSHLANSRPEAAMLNSYFVWMSAGGIAGGIFNGLIAPLSFSTQAEYAFTLIVAILIPALVKGSEVDEEVTNRKEIMLMLIVGIPLAIISNSGNSSSSRIASESGFFIIVLSLIITHLFYKFRKASGIILAIVCALAIYANANDPLTIFIDRSFFGILKISSLRTDGEGCDPDLKIPDVQDVFYRLHHGTTLHGVERKVLVRPVVPLSYYSREGPVGRLFRMGLINRRFKNIGVVGLGCGTLAWYGRKWQHFDFFEIDPKVIELAENPRYFTYLTNTAASWKNIAGDARINLQFVPDNHYDLLVIDAYSSDSVPVHLVTLEAFQLYRRKLKKDGVLFIHISNRYFKFAPLVRLMCDKINFSVMRSFDDPIKYSIKYDWYDYEQLTRADWVVASQDQEALRMLKKYGPWEEIPVNHRYKIWTDDYANMLQIYNWL